MKISSIGASEENVETKEITFEGLSDLFAKQKTDVEGMVNAKLSDWKATYRIDNGPEKPAEILNKDKTTETAKVAEAGALKGFMDFQIGGIPVGKAAVGGGIAIFATELIDGLLQRFNQGSKTVTGLVKLAGAGAAIKWGGKYLGKEGAAVVALLMAFDGIRDITPIDTWMNNIANKISGYVPTGGLGAQQGKPNTQTKDNSNYYSRAFGR